MKRRGGEADCFEKNRRDSRCRRRCKSWTVTLNPHHWAQRTLKAKTDTVRYCKHFIFVDLIKEIPNISLKKYVMCEGVRLLTRAGSAVALQMLRGGFTYVQFQLADLLIQLLQVRLQPHILLAQPWLQVQHAELVSMQHAHILASTNTSPACYVVWQTRYLM